VTALLAAAAGLAAVAALGYAAYAAATWYRYGRAGRRGPGDALLDHFVPRYEVREHHERSVRAPAGLTLECAQRLSFGRSPLVRVIFWLRSIPSLLRGASQPASEGGGIVREMRVLGWGLLAEAPGREIVMGAVTQPWKAEVVFRAVPAEEFADFHEPGYVKIAWTLAVEANGASRCVFRTETRAVATDAASRSRFRRYWACLRLGIVLIRFEMLRMVAAGAQRLYRASPLWAAQAAAGTRR
jgi:hypothetical protein